MSSIELSVPSWALVSCTKFIQWTSRAVGGLLPLKTESFFLSVSVSARINLVVSYSRGPRTRSSTFGWWRHWTHETEEVRSRNSLLRTHKTTETKKKKDLVGEAECVWPVHPGRRFGRLFPTKPWKSFERERSSCENSKLSFLEDRGGGDSNSRVPRPKVGAFRPPSRRHGGRGRRPRAPKVLWGPRQVAQGAVHLDLVRRDLLQARREDREEAGQVRQDSEAQG